LSCADLRAALKAVSVLSQNVPAIAMLMLVITRN